MIQLNFDAATPEQALAKGPSMIGYSQHEGAEKADWGAAKLQIVNGTHPVVYPASGSHANYFDSAIWLGRTAQQGVGCDDTEAPHREVTPTVADVPEAAVAVPARVPMARLPRVVGREAVVGLQRPNRAQPEVPVDAPDHVVGSLAVGERESRPARSRLG